MPSSKDADRSTPSFTADTAVVDLGDGLWAPVPHMIRTNDHEGFDVVVTVDSDGGGLRVSEVTVKKTPKGPELEPTSFRRIRLGELTTSALANAIQYDPETVGAGRRALNPIALVLEHARHVLPRPSTPTGRRELPDDDGLRLIAVLHRAATLTGMPPAKLLIDGLGIPRSTANYWISQARRRGYITAGQEP